MAILRITAIKLLLCNVAGGEFVLMRVRATLIGVIKRTCATAAAIPTNKLRDAGKPITSSSSLFLFLPLLEVLF